MRLKEQRLWDVMLRHSKGTSAWLLRMENVVGEGTPDVYVVMPHGRASWVELKAPTRPVRDSTRLLGAEGLNQHQINWHVKAHSMGVMSYVLIRDDAGRLFLVEGVYADELNEMPTHELAELSLASTWDEVWEALT